ncbi:MAG: hypothetical protein LBC86_00085 [Oscillospiraceae bacterium]|nr:hypothetical protein [Oscillospiraceae bacterium]
MEGWQTQFDGVVILLEVNMGLFKPAWKSNNKEKALKAIEKMNVVIGDVYSEGSYISTLCIIIHERRDDFEVQRAALLKLMQGNKSAAQAHLVHKILTDDATIPPLAADSTLSEEILTEIYNSLENIESIIDYYKKSGYFDPNSRVGIIANKAYEREAKTLSERVCDVCNQPSINKNLGTRIETQSASIGYWMHERMSKSVKEPFVYYIFSNESSARNALLEMPFIHEDNESGKLNCDKSFFTFGYYSTTENSIPTGKWDAFVAGNDLTHDMWKQLHEVFKKHGGIMKSDLEPDISNSTQSISFQKGNPQNASFVRENYNDGATYLTYNAPCKADAIAFLSTQNITQKLYYVVVETPDGNFGIDIDGLYEE